MKKLAWAIGLLLCTALAPASAQEAYPTKPLRIVVPIGPGGSADLGARVVARKLSEELGQPVVVENRPGGNQVVGIAAVQNAPADGYTLLWTTSGLYAAAVVNKTVPFDALKDFEPITLGGRTNAAVILHPAVPATDLASFVDYAKKNPGKLNFGSTGGSVTLLFQHFMQTVGIDMTAVLYKSQPAIWADVMSGQIEVMIERPSATKGHVASGRVKVVAVTGGSRDADMPDMRTVAEQGYHGFDIYTWQGMFIRAGTPADRVARIKTAMARIMANPEVRKQFLEIGVEPIGSTSEELAAQGRREAVMWKTVADKSGFKAE